MLQAGILLVIVVVRLAGHQPLGTSIPNAVLVHIVIFIFIIITFTLSMFFALAVIHFVLGRWLAPTKHHLVAVFIFSAHV
jgi:hypothetical protein